MTEFVQFRLDDGDQVLVVANADDQGVSRAARTGEVVDAAAASFSAALAGVKRAAYEAMREFRQAAESPDEVEIEFGVLLNAEAGAVIAKTGVEGHLKVTVTWRRPDAATG